MFGQRSSDAFECCMAEVSIVLHSRRVTVAVVIAVAVQSFGSSP